MNHEHLYTVIAEVYQTQEVFIDQFRTTATRLDQLLFAWVAQAVARGFIKGTDDPKVPFRDITERNNRLELLGGVFNIWRIGFLIGKDFYVEDVICARNDGILDMNECINVTLDFTKTSTAVSLLLLTNQGVLDAPTSRALRKALEKYEFYKEQHERLKGIASLSKAVTKERKKVEKQLLYWHAKQDFLRLFYNRDATSQEETLYTITMYYRGGTYIRQFSWILGNDLQFVLLTWLSDVFLDIYEAKIIAPQDRLLLMEKASQSIYSPVPVEGCVNVWSTYFSLSAGMAKITIIKTALDEAVQA